MNEIVHVKKSTTIEYVGQIVGHRLDPNFKNIRRLLQLKGRCSDVTTDHVKFMTVLSLSKEDIIACASLHEVKEKYPEEFI